MAINWFDTGKYSTPGTTINWNDGTSGTYGGSTNWGALGLDAAGTALNSFQGFAKYKAAKDETKAKEAWQKYHNTMVNLSNATN